MLVRTGFLVNKQIKFENFDVPNEDFEQNLLKAAELGRENLSGYGLKTFILQTNFKLNFSCCTHLTTIYFTNFIYSKSSLWCLVKLYSKHLDRKIYTAPPLDSHLFN